MISGGGVSLPPSNNLRGRHPAAQPQGRGLQTTMARMRQRAHGDVTGGAEMVLRVADATFTGV
jgi:hypothetical protein